MKIIDKIVQSWSTIFKSIKTDNKKQLAELERLEKQIEDLQASELKAKSDQAPVTNRMMLKFRLIGIFAIFIAYVSYQSLNILYLILAAFIVSIAIEAIIEFLQKTLRHRGIAILLSYLFLVVLVLAGMFFIVPFLLSQLSQMLTIFTANIAHIQQVFQTTPLRDLILQTHWLPDSGKETVLTRISDPKVLADVQLKLQDNMAQLINIGTNYARNIGGLAVTFVGSFFSFMLQTSIVLTLSVLFSLQKSSVMKFISGLRGEKQYKFVYMKLERIYKKLGIWLKSQLLLCIFIGLMVYLGLRIISWCGMDIPQKWSIALIAGMLELIPYMWPIFSWALAMIVATIHFALPGALVVLIMFLLVQWIENNILIPILMNKTLGVNPIVIFISMIIGGLVMGIVGVLLAVPISVIITMMFDKTFDE